MATSDFIHADWVCGWPPGWKGVEGKIYSPEKGEAWQGTLSGSYKLLSGRSCLGVHCGEEPLLAGRSASAEHFHALWLRAEITEAINTAAAITQAADEGRSSTRLPWTQQAWVGNPKPQGDLRQGPGAHLAAPHEINSNIGVALAVPVNGQPCQGTVAMARFRSQQGFVLWKRNFDFLGRKFLTKTDMNFLGWEQGRGEGGEAGDNQTKKSSFRLATGVVQSSQGVVGWPIPRSSLPAPPGGKKDIRAIAVGIRLGSKGPGIQFLLLPFCMSGPHGLGSPPPVRWERPFTAQVRKLGLLLACVRGGEITAGRKDLRKKAKGALGWQPGRADSCLQRVPRGWITPRWQKAAKPTKSLLWAWLEQWFLLARHLGGPRLNSIA